MSTQFEWKYGGKSVHLAGSLVFQHNEQIPPKYDPASPPVTSTRHRYQRTPSLLNSADYQPTLFPITENGPPKLGVIKRHKFSSTATIFLSSSICAPDIKEIVICLSRVLYYTIKNQEKKEPKKFEDIFSEEKYPLMDGKTDLFRTPDESEIQEFLVLLFSSQDLSAECGVMTAAYVDRLVQLTGLTLHASNWRRIVLGALLLASKIWEDVGVWNVDYLYSLPNLRLRDLLLLERQYLHCLQFTVFMNQSVYAKYYFELRALSDLTEGNFPLRPLDHKGAEELEARSRGIEVKIRNRGSYRTNSLDTYHRDSPVTLEQLQKKFGKKEIMELSY